MCLAIPGKVLNIFDDKSIMKMARVDFAGIVKEVSLAYIPEVKPGDYVIVHVGFAISKLNKEEADKTFEYLNEISRIEKLRETKI